jgi:putative two-component system response regulator
MKTIFAVDDSDTYLSLIKKALEGNYRILTMPSAAKMFLLLQKITPDLILLDIEMPGMDGSEALLYLKTNSLYADIPVIFLTSYADDEVEARGFEMGVMDFITKPFSTPVLLNRIKMHLDIGQIIQERTAQIRRLQNGIITVLADVVEERDKATGGHNDRTSAYLKILIEAMEEHGVYADEISEWDMDKIVLSARLHDMGKIHVLDMILNKPDRLSDDEYEQMKLHPTEGALIIDRMIKQTGEEEFLHNAKLFAEFHHEHWNGKGYPHGLKETEIPLQGRILAVVDAYDAIISKRSYKPPLTHEEAVNIISKEAGKQFDPKIVGVFLEVKDRFKEKREVL